MRRNRIITTLLALAGLLPANAQYTFTLNVSWSGNCSGYTAQMNSMMGKYKSQAINGFPTRELCEQTRAMCHQELGHIELVYYDVKTGKVIKREATNCKLNVTTTPCTGRPMAGTVGTLNVLGVSQGTSFYSTNSANEIQNWSRDDMERMLALDKSFNSFEPTNVSTGDVNFDNARNNSLPTIDSDKLFVPINMRDEQGNITQPNEYYFGEVMSPNDERWNYFLEKEFTDELHSEYFQEKKINIEDILLKDNKTQFEIDLISDYEEWKRLKLEETAIFKNMAICASAVYADASQNLLSELKNSNLMRIYEAPDEAMNRLIKMIDLQNEANYNQGFHAEVFYNDESKEYVVSFRGTETPSTMTLIKEFPSTLTSLLNPLPGTTAIAAKNELNDLITNLAEGRMEKLPQELHDISTDASQALGRVLTQYKMTIEVGEVIRQIVEANSDIKINITGHSLGGGEAIVAGAISGQPTYAFNPAGVHDATFKRAGIDKELANANNNIHKITTDDDPLTNTQESIGIHGQQLNKVAKGLASTQLANNEKSVPSAIGNSYKLHTGKGHSIEPIAFLLINKEKHIQGLSSENKKIQNVNIYIE